MSPQTSERGNTQPLVAFSELSCTLPQRKHVSHVNHQLSKRRLRFLSVLGERSSGRIPNDSPSWKTNSDISMHLPLQRQDVPPLSTELIRDVEHSSYITANERLSMKYLYDIRSYPSQDREVIHFPSSSLLMEDYHYLWENDIVEVCKEIERGHFSYVFSVREDHKHRRRAVMDALSANVCCPDPPPVYFTPIAKLRRSVLRARFGMCLDLKSFYHQIPLAPQIRHVFTFKSEDEFYYRFTRLPMGFKWAVYIAQAIMNYLSACVIRLFPDVHVETYIDNVLFFGDSRSAVSEAGLYFQLLCKKYGVTVGEQSEVSDKCEFRGLLLDFTSKHTSLTAKFVSKFTQHWNTRTNTWADYRALIGSIVYAYTASERPLSQIFHVLKLLARNATHDPRSPVVIWAQANNELHKALSVISANVPVKVINPQSYLCIITDACTETNLIAYVIVTPGGRILSDAKSPSSYHSINDMEASALLWSLDMPLAQRKHIVYYGDNTSVIACLQRAGSKSFFLDLIIGRIIMRLYNIQSLIHPFFIRSELNPADAPTRRSAYSYQHRSFLQSVISTFRRMGVGVGRHG